MTAGLVSILIPCVGQLEYTKLLVPSIVKHTREPYELIFIDIGSLDGTKEYLAGIRDMARVRVEVVRTPTDLGIKDAVSSALRLVRGEYVVLLNNDTLVTPHWLEQLIALADHDANIGMAGPMSNYAAPPQLVETVPYRFASPGGVTWRPGMGNGALVDVSAVEAYAREFREQHKKKWIEVERLGGFCLLIKRSVLKIISQTSAFHDWTDLGLFDTDILSTKVRQEGFKLACARDLFVHHFGSRIFAHGAATQAPSVG